MERTETFQVTNIAAFSQNLLKLAQHCPDYDLTGQELLQKGLVGVRIYEFVYPCEEVTLADSSYERIPAPQSEDRQSPQAQDAADAEPADCLLVMVTGEPVGYIRKANYTYLKKLRDAGEILSLSLELHGGSYRIMLEEDTDCEPALADGQAGYFGLLTVTAAAPDPEKQTQESDTGTMHYISTSYDTRLLAENGRRGNAALVFALLLGAFYLGFSIPYWIMVRRGIISASPYLGGDLSNALLNPHLGLVIGAVVLTALGALLKNCIPALLAAGLFTGSAWFLPGYALFTAPSALFCMIAAFKKRPRGAFTIVKVLFLLAVLGLNGWFLRDTALYVWNQKAFMVRPTGNEEALAPVRAEDDGWNDDLVFGNDDMDFDDEDDFA